MIKLCRGARPSPRHRLAGARPHVATADVPPQWLWLPERIDMWGNGDYIDANGVPVQGYGDCTVAEEAFTKACSTPEIFIPADTVIAWAQANGAINGDTIIDVLDKMQAGGFVVDDHTYGDGAPVSIDWTHPAILQSAIAQGPVKVGITADQLQAVVQDPPANGWFATGFTTDAIVDHCTSLCGYGPIAWLAAKLGVTVPDGIDGTAPAYAMFTWDSIGIIDVPSLNAICGEAWLRSPTTIVR